MYTLPDDFHAKLSVLAEDLSYARNEAIWAMLVPLLKEHFELVVDLTGAPVALRCKPAEENASLRAALEFYADQSRYEEGDVIGHGTLYSSPPILGDYGQRARATLQPEMPS